MTTSLSREDGDMTRRLQNCRLWFTAFSGLRLLLWNIWGFRHNINSEIESHQNQKWGEGPVGGVEPFWPHMFWEMVRQGEPTRSLSGQLWQASLASNFKKNKLSLTFDWKRASTPKLCSVWMKLFWKTAWAVMWMWKQLLLTGALAP